MDGLGTVRIKMDDGIVRELKEVRYVPHLKRNLISVGTLEASGMVISVRDGDLRMIKGSMVVMKGVRQGNIYYLKVVRLQIRWRLRVLQIMLARGYGRERLDRKKKNLC